jgi:hypothetical protein
MIGVVIALNNESAETVSVERRNVMRLVFTNLLGYSTKNLTEFIGIHVN